MASSREIFSLHEKLSTDSHHVVKLSLCEVRLIDDMRWPWLILIPQRPSLTELHEMTPFDQTMMTFETNLIATIMQDLTQCLKINSGALGNVVRQLHFHIVARNEGDANWPSPVWGFGTPTPYDEQSKVSLIERLNIAISA